MIFIIRVEFNAETMSLWQRVVEAAITWYLSFGLTYSVQSILQQSMTAEHNLQLFLLQGLFTWQEWEDEIASLVLLVLPPAGSLTVRESEEDSLAPTPNGGMATGSEMQNKWEIRGGTEGQGKTWKRKDEQKQKKVCRISQKLETGTKAGRGSTGKQERRARERLKKKGFSPSKHPFLHNSELAWSFVIILLSKKLLS